MTGTAGLAPSKAYTKLVDSASGLSQVDLLDVLYLDVLNRLLPTNNVKATTRSPSVLATALVAPFNMDSLAAIHAAPGTQPHREIRPRVGVPRVLAEWGLSVALTLDWGCCGLAAVYWSFSTMTFFSNGTLAAYIPRWVG